MQVPAGMLVQECLHPGAALAGAPTGNLAKSLKLTLDSRSSPPPETADEISSQRIPDTAPGREHKKHVLIHLTVSVFCLSHLK